MVDIKAIETKWQNKWEEAKVFEPNPQDRDKFFMTVPYPYISGSLHIGHARVVTEADVYTRFQRMQNKNTLFPIAFHISGTPVLGISLAIKNGDQKKIDLYKGYVKQYVSDENEVNKIVQSFEDPKKIVEFFIPKMKDEFKTLGLSVDWRRSYTSGDPEHQALVEWQFKKYKEKNYLVQGKYPILFSKTLNNAVGEDDIQGGDTDPVDLQEFTLIKFKFEDAFMIAATLRPETMYGQTNMWVNPDVVYHKVKVNDEVWIISDECVEKLKFQDKTIEKLSTISGTEMIGKRCFAPFVERDILILPSLHCDPTIGTGIVTSVPSDAPFDYIALKELQDSEEICNKYNLNNQKVKDIKLLPIIKSKGYGDFPAVEICKKMNITKLEQHDLITQATQEIYKQGFHTGVMREECEEYKGLPVTIAKDKMKQALLDNNKADILYEPSRKAFSRDGGEVIVAILDNQWFLDFNASDWKKLSKECLDNIELWPKKYRKQFEDVFDWLDKRPCARMRGLGTKLPFDEKWVIESLSDSTIYMSLYPIIHIIRENNIKKEQLTSDFFEFVMNSKGDIKDVSSKTNISVEILENMNKEWNYWYPFDQRHTFTAHLSNHLSFMIFAHTAVFEKKHWPKRISFHGMIISEGDKMSKSKGNVITLMDINNKFGADPFRAFMCNSTSVESQFNWESNKVLVMKKHLASLYNILEEIQNNKEDNGLYKKFASYISKTERGIKRATKSLEIMNIRDYSNVILFEFLTNYKYIKGLANEEELKSINNYIGNKWVTLIAPLIPHMAEELWTQKGFVSVANWPKYDESLIDEEAEFSDDFLDTIKADLNSLLKMTKMDNPKKITFLIANNWKFDLMKVFKTELEKTRNFSEILKVIMQTELKQYGKDITKILPSMLKDNSKIPTVVKSPEEEFKIIELAKEALEKKYCSIEVLLADESDNPKGKSALPGKPGIIIE